jgi:hypothetical protein
MWYKELKQDVTLAFILEDMYYVRPPMERRQKRVGDSPALQVRSPKSDHLGDLFGSLDRRRCSKQSLPFYLAKGRSLFCQVLLAYCSRSECITVCGSLL